MEPSPRARPETGKDTRLIPKLHHRAHLILLALACLGLAVAASAVLTTASKAGDSAEKPADLTLPFAALWRTEVGQVPLSTWRAPLEDGLLILPGSSWIEARAAASGALLWQHPLDDLSPRCAVILRDLVLVGGVSASGGSDLRALDLITGEIVFAVRVGGVFVAPIAVDSTLVAASSHVLAAIDLDGAIRWQVDFPRRDNGLPGGPILCQPAVLGSRVVVGAGDSKLHAYDLDTGREAWSVGLPRTLHSGVACDGMQAVVATDQLLLALDAEGRERWRYPITGDPLFATPRITDGAVYAATGTGASVLALEAASGRLLWQTPLGAQVYSRPLLTRSHVVVGDMDGRITLLDQRSGQIVGQWSLDSGSGIHLSDPVIEQGLIGAGTTDGVFHVFESGVPEVAGGLRAAPNPFTGQVVLTLDLDGDSSPQPLPGWLVVYDANGRQRRSIALPAGAPWTWDGRDAAGRRLTPGVYFLRLEAGGRVLNAKVELLP